jgi:hypothetical protein
LKEAYSHPPVIPAAATRRAGTQRQRLNCPDRRGKSRLSGMTAEKASTVKLDIPAPAHN